MLHPLDIFRLRSICSSTISVPKVLSGHDILLCVSCISLYIVRNDLCVWEVNSTRCGHARTDLNVEANQIPINNLILSGVFCQMKLTKLVDISGKNDETNKTVRLEC